MSVKQADQNHPTGTVTFLFTDIEGSTKLALSHPQAWEDRRQRHNHILQSAVSSQAGYTFQVIGDAYCAAFHSAGAALRAAIQAQVDLQAENWDGITIRVRMGIHSGRAEVQPGGDYVGYAVLSRVQRLMSAGSGGQTLISQTSQELLLDELPQDVSLRDLGLHRLKDQPHPEHLYQLDLPGLPFDFPPIKTQDLHQNNLPFQVTPFVGRDREIAAVLGLLRNPQVRLVTLTGAGGTGKTRLSLQVASDLLDDFENGVWFVELASLTDPQMVLPAIAASLKVKDSQGEQLEHNLQAHLRNWQTLLVIDNFEQVISAGPLLARLLAAAPRLKLLVSSREILHLRGEHDYPVPPLGLPESRRRQTALVLAQYEAIALFIQHARAAQPSFELNEENAWFVAEICRKLDGMPLAIELAAARSRLFKPAQMLEKLKYSLNLLTGGARDLPARQQTIRGAIDWSVELLDEAEKNLFARLGVFSGGWCLADAETICSPGLDLDVISGLESLQDKSLLRQVDGLSGQTRFKMLETLREYALEKLSLSGRLPDLQQAHAAVLEARLDATIEALSGPDEVLWFAGLDDELDNLRLAVEWAFAHDQVNFIFKVGRLYQYWSQRGILREPLAWLERALSIQPADLSLERARAMNNTANLWFDTGNPGKARVYYESALALFRAAGNDDGSARCLNNLGNLATLEKDFEKARRLYEECLQIGNPPDSFGVSLVLNNLGTLARVTGDFQAARDYFDRSLRICQMVGSDAGISYANGFLGLLALVERDLEKARLYCGLATQASWVRANPLALGWYGGVLAYIDLLLGSSHISDTQGLLRTALECVLEMISINTNLPEVWLLLDGFARVQLGLGQYTRAAQLFGAAWTQRSRDDSLLTEAERPDYEALTQQLRSALGAQTFEQHFESGTAMPVEQALRFALETQPCEGNASISILDLSGSQPPP